MLDDPNLHALAMRALDAAKSAGASYADVRFTVTRRRTFSVIGLPADQETAAVGVRALAKGAWGFTAITEWTPDDMPRLGRLAAQQARANAWPNVPPIELGDRPPVATGSWQTPITRDPFAVPTHEVQDLIANVASVARQQGAAIDMALTFERQDRTFASTDGAYVTQTIYTSLGGSPHQDVASSYLHIGVLIPGKVSFYEVPGVSAVGAGYEAVEALGLLANLPEWAERARSLGRARPFQSTGEFDVVFDGYAMAPIVDRTWGVALEYDRAIGYEANTSGTSYLAPPDQILGRPWAPATVTVTADRTLAAGAGTVRWDDDGIAPQPTPFVKGGVVVDYATSREFASELAPWYHQQGGSVRSNGCAASESALQVPLVHTPNLILHPGDAANSFGTLLSGIDNGYAILGGPLEMDMQQMTGRGRGGIVYEVKHGKLGAPVSQVAYTFKSRDLWHNLIALGGAGTAASCGLSSAKGKPNQVTMHTVAAVAARFEKVRLQPASQA